MGKMRSRQYCKKMMIFFGVESFEELKKFVMKCQYNNDMKYQYSCDAAPSILNYIEIDEIGSLN